MASTGAARRRFWNLYCLLLALLIVFQICLGIYMTGLGFYHPWYHAAPRLHRSVGVLIALMGALRLAVKLHEHRPGFLPLLKSFRHEAFGTAHLLLYPLILLASLSGFLFAAASGETLTFFGEFSIPPLVHLGKRGEKAADGLHLLFVYSTALIIVRHAMERMWRERAKRRARSEGRGGKG